MNATNFSHSAYPIFVSTSTTNRAVTLVEVLVVIAVVAILVGLVVPALRDGREVARRSVCERRVASHMTVLACYAADHSDAWPFPFEKDRCEPRALVDGTALRSTAVYESGASLWQYPVLEAYGGRGFHESLICPSDQKTRADAQRAIALFGGDETSVRMPLTYFMSMAMILSPEALDPNHPSMDAKYHVGQTMASVQFTSRKAAIVEVRPVHDFEYDQETGVTFLKRSYLTVVAAADGSAGAKQSSVFVPGVVFDSSVQGVERELMGSGVRLIYTPHGVRGRDW